jgi:hypothetical protein
MKANGGSIFPPVFRKGASAGRCVEKIAGGREARWAQPVSKMRSDLFVSRKSSTLTRKADLAVADARSPRRATRGGKAKSPATARGFNCLVRRAARTIRPVRDPSAQADIAFPSRELIRPPPQPAAATGTCTGNPTGGALPATRQRMDIGPCRWRILRQESGQNSEICSPRVAGSVGRWPSSDCISRALAGLWPAKWLLK